MRSSFITLTFAVVCLLGSSLASPVYDKRALGGIGQAASEVVDGATEAAGGAAGEVLEDIGQIASEAVGEAVGETGGDTGEALEGIGQGLGGIIGRSVPGDGDGGHLNKRRRILKKILRGAHRFSGSRSPRLRM
ncbi:hypothetical protein RMATCC62417_03664 [Rhizopus microsporus]|nr:hypothetical protein RMATCC62417_03664 [Rhizopus microsporus]